MSVIFSECYVHVHTFDSDHAQHIEYVRYIYILLILFIIAGYIIGIAHHNQISHIFILILFIYIFILK